MHCKLLAIAAIAAMLLPGYAFSPSFGVAAGSNGKIVFASNRDGNYEIYVMNPDGSNETGLTGGAAQNIDPVWSPDGKKIAFASDNDIYIMDANGEDVEKLTEGEDIDVEPAWSPDGSRIAFARSSSDSFNNYDPYDIYVVNVDGSSAVNLTDDDGDDRRPDWSPDGKIAFMHSDDSDNDLPGSLEEFDIYVMDANGTAKEKLTTGAYPSWSLDGSKIAFTKETESGSREIYTINGDSTNETRITDDDSFHNYHYPSWSPDGKKIVFASLMFGGFEIFTIDSDGGDLARLTDAAGSSTTPDFQAIPPLGVNGKIAFASANGDGEISVIGSDGGQTVRLTREGDSYPRWSPDGLKIAFVSNRTGNPQIYTINPDGTGETVLVRSAIPDSFPAWSPDGKRLAFIRSDGIHDEVYVINSDGAGEERLTEGAKASAGLAWSPDGRQIAFTNIKDGNEEIYVMDDDGDDQENLTHNAAGDYLPSWSPDGTRIAFVSTRDGNEEIYLMNPDGTELTRLTNNASSDSHPDWSPDGTEIVFSSTRDDRDSEIYLMDADGTDVVRLTQNSYDDLEPDFGPQSQYSADTAAPLVAVTPDRAPDRNGYYTHAVRFTIQGNDTSTGDSGIESCDTALTHVAIDGNGIAIEASCTDNAGNVGHGSVAINYDDSLPELSIASPAGGSSVKNPVKIAGQASDKVSGVEKVEISVDSGPYKAASLDSSSWSFTAGELQPNAGHKIKARATDGAGNMETIEIAITVAAGSDSPAPSIVKKQVMLPTGEAVDLEIQSLAQITEFGLDAERNRVSLTVQGDGQGTIVIPISRVLDGPYVVTIDGQAADFEIMDGTSGESSVQLQHQPGTVKIEITGTRVVPEFTSMLAAMAALMTIVVLAAARARPKI